MKNILYYITDHGRGHATRTVAMIRELKKSNVNVIIRNSNQINFLKNSLFDTQIISGITDVGPTMNSDGISINQIDSKLNIEKWINNFDFYVNNEQSIISKTNPDLIISDISAMPLLAAKKSKIPSLAISNFSWYDTLLFLDERCLMILLDAYDSTESLIRLPLGTSMNHFQQKFDVDIISRLPTKDKNDIKTKLRIKNKYLILFVMGPNFKLKSTCDSNIDVILTNSAMKDSINIVSVDDWIEGQNLVAASDLVICKCGYGIISECLTNGIPFHYVMDSNHIEQLHIHKYLERHNLGRKLDYEELNNFHFTINYMSSLVVPTKYQNGTQNAVQYINKFL